MILGISPSENKYDYDRFWENFGKFLKLGCLDDKANHKRIAPLLRFFSNQSENELISLGEYVENMKPQHKDIYYIAADSVTTAKNAPFLERVTEKEYEVLFLVDPMDEVAIQNLKSYKEKNFVDINKEDLDLGDMNEEKEKDIKQEVSQTCDWIKKRLEDFSSRSAMELRVWMSRLSRLSSTALYKASLLPFVTTHNFSKSPQPTNCNRYFSFFYQFKWHQSSIVNMIQIECFSSSSITCFSQKVLEQSRLSELMKGIGFREETVKRLFEELPLVLLKDSAGFRKKLDLLKYFGLSLHEIDMILFTFPEYFGLNFHTRLKPLVGELDEMNFSHAEVRAVILENPMSFLRLEPGELSRCVAFLDSLRCRYMIKERILDRGYLQAAINVKLRIECFHKHGLTLRDAFKVLYVEPRAILYDLEDREEKIKFLLHKMGFCIEHLVECPEYFGVNLEKQNDSTV